MKSLAVIKISVLAVGFASASVLSSAQTTESSSTPAQYVASKSDDRTTGESEKGQLPAAKAPSASADAYRVGIEDELQINVWREPELSSTVVVRPDGMITLPLLNDIKIVGLTTEELQTMLTDRLKTVLNEPQVTVIPRQIRSRRVYLVGEVGRPGVYPLNTKKTVLQLLAEAGGVGPFAKSKSIYVVRNENGVTKRLPFNYKKALAAKDNSQDFELFPGDMIVIP